MSLHIKAGGSWRPALAVRIKRGGSWVPAHTVWRKINGTWVAIWTTFDAFVSPNPASAYSGNQFTAPQVTLTGSTNGGGGGAATYVWSILSTTSGFSEPFLYPNGATCVVTGTGSWEGVIRCAATLNGMTKNVDVPTSLTWEGGGGGLEG